MIIVYYRNYLSCQGNLGKLGDILETKGQEVIRLPMYRNECSFEGYNSAILMKETAKIRKLITKRGTMKMLIPLVALTSQ